MIRPDKWKKLEEQMAQLGLYEHDLQEKFIRSSGKGGQNVNKVSSCVYLKHNPSGLEVKCQKTRSQQDNRYLARQILCDKMDQIQNKRASEKQQAIEKIRRQKRKRSKRAKEKMLQEKHRQSDKKSNRRKPETTG
ncbi:MAG: peptide chain release factor-like protein [Deltaproteobacteria bacterium CG11_big_fil_rev_8_21_14_0_20_45_16]|nr:MAG: peptide chain release factor-like protein [Deltaproteobacteria bacterium CG11_big_fil_rev_8_21_14_0_20_45_16]